MTNRPPKEEVGPEANPVTSEPIDIGTDLARRRSHGGPPGGGGATLGERVTRLETLFEGFTDVVDSLRHAQNWTLGAIGILAAVVIGMGVYVFARLDSLSDKVDAVPQQVNSNMHELVQTLSASITASKQQPTQVILVPQPQALQQQQSTPKQKPH